jgi:hypothetical protein
MKAKYKIGQIVYVGTGVSIEKDSNGEWKINDGGIREQVIRRISTSDDGKKIIRVYHMDWLKLNENDMPSMCFLTKEDAEKAWKKPNKETVKSLVEKKIHSDQTYIDLIQKDIISLQKLL